MSHTPKEKEVLDLTYIEKQLSESRSSIISAQNEIETVLSEVHRAQAILKSLEKFIASVSE